MIAYWSANWFTKAVLTLMTTLSYSIYGLVKIFCGLFMEISKISIFSEGMIDDFTKRIYVILGIYMLFKLVFSLFSSIVNPDMLMDKEKGMGKIVTRTIIALAMLILVPTIFTKALGWQNTIAYAIPRVILGVEQITPDETEQHGEDIAALAFKTFLTKHDKCETAPEVREATEGATLSDAVDLALETCSDKKGEFMYEYNFFISLIAGIIMVIMLASYCIDIAIRGIKIGILQIVAPIPIISYIDPKSSKNGAFSNWLKECGSTYIELFIKLAILYLVIAILGEFANGNIAQNTNLFVIFFIILGAFFFMGKAADFICNILGIKKPEKNGGFLKGLAGIGAAVGIGAAAISSGLTNYRGSLASQKANGVTAPSKGKAIASAMLGAGMGVATAGKAVAGAKSGKMGAALSAANKRNTAYATAAASGATMGGKVSSYFQRAFTGQTQADRLEQEIKTIEDNSKNISGIVSRADDKAKTSTDTVGFSQLKDANGRVIKQISGNYQQWSAAFNAAKAKGSSAFTFNGTSVTMEEAERLDFGLLTSNSECYIRNHGFGDKEFQEMIIDYENANPGRQINQTTTRKDMKQHLENVNVDKSQKARELRKAKANADATNSK